MLSKASRRQARRREEPSYEGASDSDGTTEEGESGTQQGQEREEEGEELEEPRRQPVSATAGLGKKGKRRRKPPDAPTRPKSESRGARVWGGRRWGGGGRAPWAERSSWGAGAGRAGRQARGCRRRQHSSAAG